MKQIAIPMLLVLAGCVTPRAPTVPEPPNKTVAATLTAGQLVEIRLCGANPSYGIRQSIDQQGRVSLPFLGLVAVAGKTVTEVRELIEKMYVDGGYYRTPDVVVLAGDQLTNHAPEQHTETRPHWTSEEMREWEERTGETFPGTGTPRSEQPFTIKGNEVIEVDPDGGQQRRP